MHVKYKDDCLLIKGKFPNSKQKCSGFGNWEYCFI